MKKLLLGLIVASMVLTLVACADNTKPNDLGNSNEVLDDAHGEIVPADDEEKDITNKEIKKPTDVFAVTVTNEDFTLTLEGKNVFSTDENIYLEAHISLDNAESLTVYHCDPILAFSLEGDGYFNDGQGAATFQTVLETSEFVGGTDYVYPLIKSGGWSNSDPDADFYSKFFSSSEYLLPEGSYKISAVFSYSTDDGDVNGSLKTLSASYSFDVVAGLGGNVSFESNESEGLSVQITYEAFDGTDAKTCCPDDEQAERIYTAVTCGEWIQSLGDCLTEYLIIINGNEYHYHSECGTVNDYTNMCCKTLDENEKAQLNGLLEELFALNG